MSDKWMNLGYDNQELKPYSEPTPDFKDERRIGKGSLKVHGASVCFFYLHLKFFKDFCPNSLLTLTFRKRSIET